MSSMFGQEALAAAVRRTLDDSPDVPKDARGAFLLVATEDGVKAVTAIRMAGDWLVQASVAWSPTEQMEYGVSVQGTF